MAEKNSKKADLRPYALADQLARRSAAGGIPVTSPTPGFDLANAAMNFDYSNGVPGGPAPQQDAGSSAPAVDMGRLMSGLESGNELGRPMDPYARARRDASIAIEQKHQAKQDLHDRMFSTPTPQGGMQFNPNWNDGNKVPNSPMPEQPLPPFMQQIISNLMKYQGPTSEETNEEGQPVNLAQAVSDPKSIQAKTQGGAAGAPGGGAQGGGGSSGGGSIGFKIKGPVGIQRASTGGGQVGDPESELEKMVAANLRARVEGLNGNKKALDGMNEQPHGFAVTDLSGLMSYADAQNGGRTNFASTYKAPTAIKDHKAAKAGLADKIEKGQQALADDYLGYFKSKLDEKKADESNDLKRQLAMAQMEAKLAASAGKGESSRWDDGKILELEDKFRMGRNAEQTYKDTVQMQSWATKMSSVNPKSPEGQLLLINAYNKLMDPQSTVRESEFKNTAEVAGLWGKWGNTWGKIRHGQQIPEELARDLQKAAGAMWREQLSTQRRVDSKWRKQLEGYKGRFQDLDPDRAIPSDEFGEFDQIMGQRPGGQAHPVHGVRPASAPGGLDANAAAAALAARRANKINGPR